MNKKSDFSHIEREPISVEEFAQEAKDVLLKPMPARPRSEKRTPTNEELNRRYKLKRSAR